MNRNAYALYQDAFERTCERYIKKVFDEVYVRSYVEHSGYPYLVVTVEITRNGARVAWSESIDLCMLTPDMYADYFRDRLPEKIAHSFTDFLLRG